MNAPMTHTTPTDNLRMRLLLALFRAASPAEVAAALPLLVAFLTALRIAAARVRDLSPDDRVGLAGDDAFATVDAAGDALAGSGAWELGFAALAAWFTATPASGRATFRCVAAAEVDRAVDELEEVSRAVLARRPRRAHEVRLLRAPAVRSVSDILRDVARTVSAEGGAILGDDNRGTVAEALVAHAAGTLTLCELADLAGHLGALVARAAEDAQRHQEGLTRRVYPLGHARAYARLAAELLDAVAARVGLPDGSAPVPADADGLAVVDLDAPAEVA